MRALWLPEVLRAAGLTVHEVSGWRTRGADSWGPVRGITIHHTAGSRTSTDEGEIRTLLTGSTSAPPPIAQLYLSRSGAWHVVASGHCNHNRVGWGGPNEGYGNDSLLGIEAQHSGGDEPWTERQYGSYVAGVAALVRHRAPGWDVKVGRVAGHKEHQPGAKTDPSFDMARFRRHVEEYEMASPDEIAAKVVELLTKVSPQAGAGNEQYDTNAMGRAVLDKQSIPNPLRGGKTSAWALLYDLAQAVKAQGGASAQTLAAVTELAGRDLVDEPAIAAAVLAGLPAEAIASAIPPGLAKAVVAELEKRPITIGPAPAAE